MIPKRFVILCLLVTYDSEIAPLAVVVKITATPLIFCLLYQRTLPFFHNKQLLHVTF